MTHLEQRWKIVCEREDNCLVQKTLGKHRFQSHSTVFNGSNVLNHIYSIPRKNTNNRFIGPETQISLNIKHTPVASGRQWPQWLLAPSLSKDLLRRSFFSWIEGERPKAYFNDAQRQSTKDAGTISGRLFVIRHSDFGRKMLS